jgi:transposase, IS6 family
VVNNTVRMHTPVIAAQSAGLLRSRMTASGRLCQRVVVPLVRAPRSSFAGFRFPPEVIVITVRWYLRYGLLYRGVEELLSERGLAVDHVTIYRWVQRFTPLLLDAARPARHVPSDRCPRRDVWESRRGLPDAGFGGYLPVYPRPGARSLPERGSTDRTPTYRRVLDKLLPRPWHIMEQYANKPVEANHRR